jgi:hypothetical protein
MSVSDQVPVLNQPFVHMEDVWRRFCIPEHANEREKGVKET